MPFIINGETIDDEVVEGEFSRIKAHFERTLQVACCERDPEFRGYARDNILSKVLLAQEAERRLPPAADSEVARAFGLLVEEHGSLPEVYMNLGIPYDDEDFLRKQIGNSLRVDSLLREVYGSDPAFEQAALQHYYDKNQAAFLTAEEIHIRHITKGLQGSKSREEVYEELRGLRRELRGGADFLTVAEAQAEQESQQIDLGFFKRGEFMEEFEAIAFSLEIGEISPVFSTPLGLHLCTLVARKEREAKPLAEVTDEIRQLLMAKEREAKFLAFVAELKAKATIELPEEELQPMDH